MVNLEELEKELNETNKCIRITIESIASLMEGVEYVGSKYVPLNETTLVERPKLIEDAINRTAHLYVQKVKLERTIKNINKIKP